MVTQFMSALMAFELPAAEGNLSSRHDDIVAALDMLSKASEPKGALRLVSRPQPAVFVCQAFSASSNTFSPGMPFSMVSSARRPVL
ncbi:MAG: hypothetical protein EOS67_07575 [Mesorhizobium sp.]|nr:MAG: hypothetical protein EOS67_07575 [Mesorhizobium sp.]